MAKRRSSKKAKDDVKFLEEALYANGGALLEGPKKKKWTRHDIRAIKPLTATQEDFFRSFYEGSNICACGSAGAGKTFIALNLAVNEIIDGRHQNKIIIVRSAVQGREQGYLPGTQEEKNAPFENPYRDILGNLCGKGSTYDDMKAAGLIEFQTTAHLRGLTWDNSIVIIDEVQNMNFSEISTTITRLGDNSRIIILGDYRQDDLLRKVSDKSGFHQMMTVINKIPSFAVLSFTLHDIVRGKLVKEWITACEETNTIP